METTNGGNAFSLTKVMTECQAYLDTVQDYEIETVGRQINTDNGIIELDDTESIKVLLKEFLFQCEDKAVKGKSHVL